MSSTKKVKAADASPPDGVKILDTQVGGHRYGENGRKMGMLDCGGGIVLKALQGPPRGVRELALYKTTFSPSCQNKDLLELRNFLPHFYGVEVVDDVTFLKMQNLTYRFPDPNVLDLKMGRITWDPEATPEKRLHEESKYPPRKDLGFQLTGMMTHDPVKKTAEHFSKDYCLQVTADTMLTKGLGTFFGLHQPSGLRKNVVSAVLTKLHGIEDWFNNQRTYSFYASSLLIIYGHKQIRDNTAASTQQTHESSPLPEPAMSDGGLQCGTNWDNSSKMSFVSSNTKTADPENGAACQTDVTLNTLTTAAGCSVSAGRKRSSSAALESAEAVENAASKSKQAKTSIEAAEEVTPSNEVETKAEESEIMKKNLNDSPLVEVRMIDFAHVFPAKGNRDDNYLFGLQRLIHHLEQLLKL